MADLKRIKSNVAKMVSAGAPEEDIDGYIAAEGVTVEDVRNFKEAPVEAGPRQYENSLSGDLARRADAVEAKKQQAKSGKIYDIEKVIAQTSEGFGIANDVMYRGIVEPAASIPIPFMGTTVGGALNQGLSAVANTPSPSGGTIGSDVSAVSGSFNRSYDVMKQQYPRTTEVTEDVANIALNLLPVAKTKVGRNVAESVTAVPREVIAAPVKIPVGMAQTSHDFVKGVKAKDAKAINKSLKTAKHTADDLYAKMEEEGPRLRMRTIDLISSAIDDGTKVVDDVVEAHRGTLKTGKPYGIRQLENLRQRFDRAIIRAPNDEKKILIEAKKKLEAMIEGLQDTDFVTGSAESVQAWRDAKAASSQYKKMQSIGTIIKKAKTPEGMRSKIKDFLSDEKKTAPFTPKEIKKLERAAKDPKLLTLLSILSPSSGVAKIPLTGGVLFGGPTGATASLALGALGATSKGARNVVKRGRADKAFGYLESSNPFLGKK